MSNTKRCSGHKGHWECSDEHPDHKVPRSEFGTHSGQPDGLQDKCWKCKQYTNGTRPRHPETDELKVSWVRTRAVRYYGASEPKAKRANPIGPLGIPWKECIAMATNDAESIAWVRPDKSNILQFTPRTWTNKNGELKTANSVTLKSMVRNDGLPEGIVTPSEKKVRRETKRIQYTPEGWIYALKDHMKEPGFLKLGKTNDLKRRLADFNTAGDFEMMYWSKVVDAKAAEDMLHAHFIDSHHLREWFKVSLKDAVEAMDSISDTVNDPDWEGIVDLGDVDES